MTSEDANSAYWLLRPSVSLIPLGGDTFDFFQSSTRRSSRFRLRPDLANAVVNLDGTRNVTEICADFNASEPQVLDLLNVLHERCIVEPRNIREAICADEFYRILNFLGDYFPAMELFPAFERVRSAKVAVFGCGAVGSWTAMELAQSGIQNFVVIDGDIVEESNLNRSLFRDEDIGLPKVRALTFALHRISPNIQVYQVSENISESLRLGDVLRAFAPDVVVNCADEPSVDVTSEWINKYCFEEDVPYVIAGGYNLHLSLIGMTVIPRVSACFNCSRIMLSTLEDESLRGVRRLWRPKRNLGSLAPLTGITSALAASEVLRLALRSERLVPAMLNRRGEFNFLTNEISFVDLPPRPECGCTENRNQRF